MNAQETRTVGAGLILRPWVCGRSLAFVVLVVVAASGCVSTGGMEPPAVTLVNLEMTDMTLFETTLTAKVRIANTNPDPLTVEGASFKLVLDGRKVGSGMTSEVVTVERLDSQVVNAVFHVNNASLLLRLRDVFENEAVSYGISGKLYVKGALGTRRLKVEQVGRLDLRGEPSISSTEVDS